MYAEALAYLTCPRDPEARLGLEAGARRVPDGGSVRGRLRCPACGARYAIGDGLADLLGPRALPASPAPRTNRLSATARAYARMFGRLGWCVLISR